ncbi:MAG: hypothetical protein H7251_12425 [Acetobacteraceae bacterium]|nr:hypothetical protein [Acetobacteraceae bacterium]
MPPITSIAEMARKTGNGKDKSFCRLGKADQTVQSRALKCLALAGSAHQLICGYPCRAFGRGVLLGIGLLWVATGVSIVADPPGFYDRTPGLVMMGPYSVHFIRDVGLAFIAAGTATVVGAWQYNRRLALAGAGWPFLHTLFHLQIWSHRGFPIDGIAAFDFIAVIAPAFLAVMLAARLSGRLADNDPTPGKALSR